jgi:putative redox protein
MKRTTWAKHQRFHYPIEYKIMAIRKVVVRMKADHEYEAENEQGNKVAIDMHAPEDKKAQSPMDLLLSALGGCASVDAVGMMRKKRRIIEDFFVEIEGERVDSVPAYYKTITLNFILVSPDATDLEFSKVVALSVEKYCSVSHSLKSEVIFKSEVRKP